MVAMNRRGGKLHRAEPDLKEDKDKRTASSNSKDRSQERYYEIHQWTTFEKFKWISFGILTVLAMLVIYYCTTLPPPKSAMRAVKTDKVRSTEMPKPKSYPKVRGQLHNTQKWSQGIITLSPYLSI